MPRIGYKQTKEHIKKVADANRGKKRKPPSEETKRKMSEKAMGRKLSEEQIEKFRKSMTGKHWKIKDSSKMGKGAIGEKNWNWKGGISKNKEYISWLKNKRNRLKRKIVGNHTFGEWELLKKQYGYCCPSCGRCEPEIKISEDHIIPLSKSGSDYIENIQPLCRSCNSRKYNKIIKY